MPGLGVSAAVNGLVIDRATAGRLSAESPGASRLRGPEGLTQEDKAQILDMAQKPWIKGFTTNPSLLRKAGVTDYEAYGRDLVAAVPS